MLIIRLYFEQSETVSSRVNFTSLTRQFESVSKVYFIGNKLSLLPSYLKKPGNSDVEASLWDT